MGGTGGWIALVTAVGQLLAGVAGKVYLSSDSRLIRKIERDAAIVEHLPADAKQVMERLLYYEVSQHALRRMRRAARTVSGSTAFALVFIAGITAAIDWLFAFLAITYGWGWWIPFGIVSLFGLLLSTVGIGQLFEYPNENPDEIDEGEAAGRATVEE
jgi:fatty acid desaturase